MSFLKTTGERRRALCDNTVEVEEMMAHRLKIVIPEDHRVVVEVPEDVPAGPAELILMVGRAEAIPFKETAVSESAKKRFRDLADELAADPRSFRDLSPEERKARLQRVIGIGRGLFSSSEEFARRKEEEIEIEDRHLGPRGRSGPLSGESPWPTRLPWP